jgi:hypothetical protein
MRDESAAATFEEIAAEVGLSPGGAFRLYEKAIRKLRHKAGMRRALEIANAKTERRWPGQSLRTALTPEGAEE